MNLEPWINYKMNEKPRRLPDVKIGILWEFKGNPKTGKITEIKPPVFEEIKVIHEPPGGYGP